MGLAPWKGTGDGPNAYIESIRTGGKEARMGRGTIMVVENDPRLRFILERQLAEADFKVSTFESGEAAFKELGASTPDLVLLNVVGVGGIGVCKRIRADRTLAHVPVIFLTGTKDPEARARCLSVGANDYILKPWESKDLILRITNAIALARSQG
jgi:two-component system phosphate regulon response regulator PhoB